MAISEIEATDLIKGILTAPNESKSVELKTSFPWSKTIDELRTNDKAIEVLRTIMALSNGKDTGYLIIGITKDPSQDNKYKPIGVTPEHLNTYDSDIIHRHVRPIANPSPQFEVFNMWAAPEGVKCNYIVFVIQSFKTSPLICANPRRLNNIAKSGIYIRNNQPETKLVSEPEEMTDLIDLAIDKELIAYTPRIQRIVELLGKSSRSALPTKPSRKASLGLKQFETENSDIKKIK